LHRGVLPRRAAQIRRLEIAGRAERALLEHLPLGAVRIVLHLAAVVEDHHGALLRPVSRPPGKTGMVRIAAAREVDPGVAHPGRQRPGVVTAASHAGRDVGVAESEGTLGTVKRARPAVEY